MKNLRGEPSERALIETLLQTDIPRQVIFHDLYLKRLDSKFTQIDLVVATPAGIIVFEVKEYRGQISGKGKDDQWMQTSQDKNYFFPNPLLQNRGHINALKKQLEPFGEIPFYSVVVFYGTCELKNIRFVPPETFVVKSERILECVAAIRAKKRAHYTDAMGMVKVLKQAVRNGEDEQIRARHIEDIKEMLGTERIFA